MNRTGAVIKVMGIGGAGGNAVDRMMHMGMKHVELICVNTDAQDLLNVKAHVKLRIGRELTRGLGAGMNPELGRKSAEENREELKEVLSGADMVFLAAGLGGGTGSGAIGVAAEIAKSQGALTIAVVTKPFSFEGSWRMRIAERALGELRGKVDTLLVIPNDKVLSITDQETSVISAFFAADEVLRQAVQGISDIITLPGIINVDFADVRSVMADAGQAVFGVGTAKGDKRIENALQDALASPLLDISIKGAEGVLFNVAGDDLTLSEINEAASIVRGKLSSSAKIIFGAVKDKRLKKGELRITLLATGFSRP
ncbi:MAG: cell division protein FtsZ [bacterium]|nr:cell division protein FtsZ [bacterium]MDZ4232129.1 cell division protein FtsZ [Candidatus Pacearchaeota archaeon]